MVFLFFLSAFFTTSEIALRGLRRLGLKGILEKGEEKSPALSLWLEDPQGVMATIIGVNNLVRIIASVLTGMVVLEFTRGEGWAIALSTGILLVTILTFAEIIPRILIARNPEKIPLGSLRILRFLSYLFLPLMRILEYVGMRILRLVGFRDLPPLKFLPPEEVKLLTDIGAKEGELEDEEREMIEEIFEFGGTTVREIMTPRIEMVCVEDAMGLKEVLETVREAGFSRIPVYHQTIDNIIGILYAKDLLNYWNGASPEEVSLKKMLREPFFVPDSKKVNELLEEFKKEKTHIAIVVDEYGGTAGLVTIEDVLEEIVGEIQDEYDEEKKMWQALGGGVFIVDARMDIEEANEELELGLPEGDFETIGGFIVKHMGKVPDRGEIMTYQNLKISILEADDRRVKKIKIVRESDTRKEKV